MQTGVLQTTAIYNHPKNPISVEVGDRVTYTIRLYNEGQIDAKITEVTDYLPGFLDENFNNTGWDIRTDTSKNIKYAVTNENCVVVGSSSNLNVTGQKLKDVVIPAAAYVAANGRRRIKIYIKLCRYKGYMCCGRKCTWRNSFNKYSTGNTNER